MTTMSPLLGTKKLTSLTDYLTWVLTLTKTVFKFIQTVSPTLLSLTKLIQTLKINQNDLKKSFIQFPFYHD